MKGQMLKLFFFLNLFFLGSLLIIPFWYTMERASEKPQLTLMQTTNSCNLCQENKNQFIDFCSQASQTKEVIDKTLSKEQLKKEPDYKEDVQPCKHCREEITQMLKTYSQSWKKKEDNHHEMRIKLNLKVNGHEKAILTQENTPVGSKFIADGDRKRTIEVKSEHFDTFLKVNPFANKTYSSCAVVGNAGILANSSCGKIIDSAEYVIRCNLPPLTNGYEKHVGVKTDLVSANPSILSQKYGSLLGARRKFMEKLCQYGNSMLLLPAFSYVGNVAVCMRAFHTIKDFGSPMQPIYFSPEYLNNLDSFWRTQGWKAVRLTTGMMLTSMALELCDNVHLYGFWPFSLHPHTFEELTNHYYDDKRPKGGFHAMPEEFKLLLKLHSQGVHKLHLGNCKPN
ncbi:alpha-2,8-sialyltransferase 8F-like [Girardinichthys multiradiatus]|uniref:alpha-2,8-sialyltransferase 8F-like n=1 Tax=Girardinichthys multiradiatus TaxID=208333 RepID=UPI001FAD28F2|nr:alpha-2,8-sialyltransferase 8F-like [Girardinichthys multiradiatus]